MNIVQPNVVLLSSPNFNFSNFQKFLRQSNLSWRRTDKVMPAEELVEVAGRICYMSFGERQSPRVNSEYIENLIYQGHESVLEHVSWTFLLTGVSRAFTHQLVRHRVGFAYSQLSQQYYDESEADVVAPKNFENSELSRSWMDSLKRSMSVYKSLISSLSSGLDSQKERNREVRSAARSVLPNAIEAKIVVTANARALRHFFDVRGSIEGDWEMRDVSVQIYKLVSKDAPSIFSDFSIFDTDDKVGLLKRV